jgi:menaquinone-specific isochorismate synthase
VTQATPLHQKRLVAHTRLLDDRVDVLDTLTARDFAWWHHGQGFVTNGVARRVPATQVREVLSDIDTACDDEAPGAGPIAVGALPFDRIAALEAELVIPARLWRRDAEGHMWVTDISESADAAEQGRVPAQVGRPDDMSRAEWSRAVGTALARIEAGELDKVVLSRQVTTEAKTKFSVADVVRRLRTDQPACYVFAAGGFVGASPELLVERRGRAVRSRPMAGTVDRRGDRTMAWLTGSTKNRREHSLVVAAVVAGLERLCSEPVQASPPYAEPFADLAHIVTDVVGTLTPDAPSALEVALVLHPTPAIAGTPTETALALIGALEARSRGRYGGPVGWVDASGDGEFAVALRCAEVQGDQAVLYAGAGIVAGSRAEDEWQETETKLWAMRRALVCR